ncbi:MAG TPA: universal stress protein [Edaphobacter sp.]|nr:universal stress protein [Edaphobacter sp.]
MKILLAVDGSKYTDVVVNSLIGRAWPEKSEVRVISVAHTIPYITDPLLIGLACQLDLEKAEVARATKLAEEVAKKISHKAPGLKVSTTVPSGSPKNLIVEEAENWNADLIMLGSHGYGPGHRLVLGSVSQAVVTHASCSVEVVRDSTAK